MDAQLQSRLEAARAAGDHADIGALMIANDLFFFVASLGGLTASLVLLRRKIKALDESKRTKVLPRATSGADRDVPAPPPARLQRGNRDHSTGKKSEGAMRRPLRA